MTSEFEAPPNSVNGGLADYFSANKESILSEWLERVRSDSTITPTDFLNTKALTNHLPQILDDLISSLRRYGSEIVAEKAAKDALNHGAERWRQGYEIPEVLREIMHFRAILIYHLRVFEDMNPDFGMISRLFVSTAMHRFLDEMGIDATEEFLIKQSHQQCKSTDDGPHGKWG